MTVHPQVRTLLDQIEAQGLPPFNEMSVSEAREVGNAFREMQGDAEDVREVRNILIPGAAGDLPARVYHPQPGTPLPLIVYFHGGGWATGNVEIVDKPARALANASQCVVVATQYRLSPETKFPGPADDCYAATAWLADNAASVGGDPARLVVAGDSAGGNLAAVVALMARDRGGPSIKFQLLMYPVIAPARDSKFQSYKDNAEGYLLTAGSMEWFWDLYLTKPEDGENPYASPLAADDLSGLPPAMVITAEYDPLRDEGAAYADALAAAGVQVNKRQYDGLIHGFFWMAGVLDPGRELIAEMGAELRKQFGT